MPRKSRKRKIAGDKSSCQENDISWFDLPLEMREVVIDGMDVKTKCKFLQCSKKCEDEVKESKNFLTSIKINNSNHPEIHIGLGKLRCFHYCLEFIDILSLSQPQIIVVYKTVNRLSYFSKEDRNDKKEIKWMKIENGRAEEVRLKYLTEFVEKYWKTIRRFEIDDDKFIDSKFVMKQLRNLEYIESYSEDIREKGLMDLEQIKKIDFCILQETEFTFEEVLQFQGSLYQIKSDDFDEENIGRYLMMLKNGEIHRNLENLSVDSITYDNYYVDCKRIAKLVDGFNYSDNDVDFTHFRFLLNYERKSKCYCCFLYSKCGFNVKIEDYNYDQVIANRRPLID
ncbi:unnamed protein product [Caenorhabditis angaria]|uniref:Uncharacterized protein n=1 Tax=Caenorhabditis angaria TaxID=860376 RepID=A0A9P1I9G3_9PELO|nr:unnamed protein product [Caenorhabditis angaria]